MIDTDELRRLAREATPGPWDYTVKVERHEGFKDFPDGCGICRPTGIWSAQAIADTGFRASRRISGDDPKDAAYIAAANPATVLALLDELDRLRAEVGRLRTENALLRASSDSPTWTPEDLERIAVKAAATAVSFGWDLPKPEVNA